MVRMAQINASQRNTLDPVSREMMLAQMDFTIVSLFQPSCYIAFICLIQESILLPSSIEYFCLLSKDTSDRIVPEKKL